MCYRTSYAAFQLTNFFNVILLFDLAGSLCCKSSSLLTEKRATAMKLWGQDQH